VALVLYLAASTVAVSPPREAINVREPVVRERSSTVPIEAPVAPSLAEIDWGSHAWESHGADADRAIRNLEICENPHTYFCVDGPQTSDTYWIYICQFPNSPGTCAGAIVGRLGKGFTSYPSTCSWWFQKVETCRTSPIAGR